LGQKKFGIESFKDFSMLPPVERIASCKSLSAQDYRAWKLCATMAPALHCCECVKPRGSKSMSDWLEPEPDYRRGTTPEPEYAKHMRELADAKVLWFVIGAFTVLLILMALGYVD
jgi:hypothetical protein